MEGNTVNWKQLSEVEEADLRLQELPGYWKWKLYTVLQSHSSSSIKDSWIQEPMRGARCAYDWDTGRNSDSIIYSAGRI